MLAFALATSGLLGLAAVLVTLGFREGDQPEDLHLVGVLPGRHRHEVLVRVVNPGRAPALVGLSLRPPRLRLLVEGGTYARLRTRAISPDLLPGHHGSLAVVDAGESRTVAVSGRAGRGGRAELVLVAGQPGRLRVIHRAIRLGTSGGDPAALRVPGRPTPDPRRPPSRPLPIHPRRG